MSGPGRVKPWMSPAERIRHYLSVDAESGCWLWTAATNDAGYGVLRMDGRNHRAHRVSYEAFVGAIPEGLQLDHLCRVRSCVNPAHLEPVTPLVNTRRSPLIGKQTACPRGHDYTEANTYQGREGRLCRTCRSAYWPIYHGMTAEERAARKAAGLPIVDLDAYFATQEVAA